MNGLRPRGIIIDEMNVTNVVRPKFVCTFVSVNKDGKSDMVVIETDSLLGAVRCVNTFRPKRGYRLVKGMYEEQEVLV